MEVCGSVRVGMNIRAEESNRVETPGTLAVYDNFTHVRETARLCSKLLNLDEAAF